MPCLRGSYSVNCVLVSIGMLLLLLFAKFDFIVRVDVASTPLRNVPKTKHSTNKPKSTNRTKYLGKIWGFHIH